MTQTPYTLYRSENPDIGQGCDSENLAEVVAWRDEYNVGGPIYSITIRTRTIYTIAVGNMTQSFPDDLPAAEAWRDAHAPGAAITTSYEDYEVEPFDTVQE